METQQALSGAGKICHVYQVEKQLGGAVPGTLLGTAPNATCGIISATMVRFATGSSSLKVLQRNALSKLGQRPLAGRGSLRAKAMVVTSNQ